MNADCSKEITVAYGAVAWALDYRPQYLRFGRHRNPREYKTHQKLADFLHELRKRASVLDVLQSCVAWVLWNRDRAPHRDIDPQIEDMVLAHLVIATMQPGMDDRAARRAFSRWKALCQRHRRATKLALGQHLRKAVMDLVAALVVATETRTLHVKSPKRPRGRPRKVGCSKHPGSTSRRCPRCRLAAKRRERWRSEADHTMAVKVGTEPRRKRGRKREGRGNPEGQNDTNRLLVGLTKKPINSGV
jgi:hypothetical protein